MEDNPLAADRTRKLPKAAAAAEQKTRPDVYKAAITAVEQKLRGELPEDAPTAQRKARIEAARAKYRSPAAHAEEIAARETLEREYRETGSLKTAGDRTTMADLVTFRRFVMSLRRERERIGLSLNDVAERAKIDKAALSRLENGQQLNPTLNTLTRYAQALGKCLSLGLSGPDGDINQETRSVPSLTRGTPSVIAPSNAQFCRVCGLQMVSHPEHPPARTCPKGCGPCSLSNRRFCEHCGHAAPGKLLCTSCGRRGSPR